MAKLTKEEIIALLKRENSYSLADIIHHEYSDEYIAPSDINGALYDAVVSGLITKDEFVRILHKMEDAYSIHMYEMC